MTVVRPIFAMLSPILLLAVLGAPTPPDLLARVRRAETSGKLDDLGEAPAARCLDPSEDLPRIHYARVAADLEARENPRIAAVRLTKLGTAEALSRALGLEATDERRRALLRDHAGHPLARAELDAFGVSKTLALFETLEDRLDLAQRWLDAHDNPAALSLAKPLRAGVGKSGRLRCRWGYIMGKAERKRRRYRSALAELSRTRALCAEADDARSLAMQVALLEARVLAIKGRTQALDAVVTWMKAFAPGHSYIDDAMLWAAETTRGRVARERFEAVADFGGDQAAAAAWRVAQSALAEKDERSARAWLSRILETDGSADDHERAAFFLGRLDLRTSTTTAHRRWAKLAARPSFYGFLALDRLRRREAPEYAEAQAKLLEAASTPAARPPAAPRVRARPEWARAQAWRTEAPDWARTELRALRCGLSKPSVAELLDLAAAFQELGAHPDAQRILRWDPRRPLQAPLTPATVAMWRLAYSRAFETEIAAASAAEKIDPLLLTALAREESVFDPDVVSWAGATGLAQLMPATALQAHVDVFGRRLDPKRLTEPALNLRLGARVLRDGLNAFGEAKFFALSAYNGGPGLTRRTLPKRRVPFEDWAESNPVRENRGYVKRVLSTWATYTLLYGAEPAPRMPRTIGPSAKVRWE